jgi:hypothetical protein
VAASNSALLTMFIFSEEWRKMLTEDVACTSIMTAKSFAAEPLRTVGKDSICSE